MSDQVKFKKGTDINNDSTPTPEIESGSILINKSTGEMYIDDNNSRIKITDTNKINFSQPNNDDNRKKSDYILNGRQYKSDTWENDWGIYVLNYNSADSEANMPSTIPLRDNLGRLSTSIKHAPESDFHVASKKYVDDNNKKYILYGSEDPPTITDNNFAGQLYIKLIYNEDESIKDCSVYCCSLNYIGQSLMWNLILSTNKQYSEIIGSITDIPTVPNPKLGQIVSIISENDPEVEQFINIFIYTSHGWKKLN